MLNFFFGHVLKRSLSAHLAQVKLLLVTFYLNGRLRAVSTETVRTDVKFLYGSLFLKTESEPNFSFLHIPINYVAIPILHITPHPTVLLSGK